MINEHKFILETQHTDTIIKKKDPIMHLLLVIVILYLIQ